MATDRREAVTVLVLVSTIGSTFVSFSTFGFCVDDAPEQGRTASRSESAEGRIAPAWTDGETRPTQKVRPAVGRALDRSAESLPDNRDLVQNHGSLLAISRVGRDDPIGGQLEGGPDVSSHGTKDGDP